MKNTLRTDIDSAGRRLSDCRAQARHDGTICGGLTIRAMACFALALILVLLLGTAAFAEAPFAAEAQPIEVGVATEVTITGDMGGYAYFSFVPSQSGVYEFYSTGSSDTYGYLYDAEGEMLSSNDDSERGTNFLISWELTAGVQYYFGARFYQTDSTGTFTVQLDGKRGLISATASGDTLLRVAPNETAVLEVVATCTEGDELYYSWYRQTLNGEMVQIEGADSATLTKEQLIEKAYYYCRVSDDYGHEQWVYFTIEIDNQFYAEAVDNDLEVAPGGAVTLAVEAECRDGEISYQWYDGEWDYDLNARPIIEGATGATLKLSGVSGTSSYCCRVSDEYNNSKEIWFYIRIENHLRAYPAGGTGELYVEANETATLRVVAKCDVGELTYEWRDNDSGNTYSDESGAVFTTEPITGYRRYMCSVSDAYGNVEWVEFYVAVENEFRISNADRTNTVKVLPNGTAVLTVNASCRNGALTYLWYDNYGNYPDNTSSILTLENVTEMQLYTCYVQDMYGNRKEVHFVVEVDNDFTVNQRYMEYINVPIGETTTLMVSASCREGGLSYRWECFGANFEDQNQATLTTLPADLMRTYSCYITDDYGNSGTVTFIVSVENGFSVSAVGGPIRYLPENGTTTLCVDAHCTEGELTYSWSRSGYSGHKELRETTDTLITEPLTESNTSYICVITDRYGNTEYVAYTLNIDNELRAWAVSDPKISLSQKSDVTMQVAGSCSSGELSYQWFRVENSPEGDHDSIYITQDICAEGASFTAENVNSAVMYRCRVSDRYNNYVNVTFEIDWENGFTTSTVQNPFYLVEPGETIALEVNASCTAGDLTYQWFESSFGATYYSAVRYSSSSDRVLTRTCDRSKLYTCIVSDQYGNTASHHFYVIVKQGTETIVPDQDVPFTISEASRAQAFSFTPTATGSYRFSGSGNVSISTGLFDQNGIVRYFTGLDQKLGPNNFFDFFMKLEAGQTYTFVVVPTFDTNASFTVHLELMDAEYHHAETQLVLPADTIRIEREAFAGINAEEVVIPVGCEYIGPMAFAYCPTLRLINIPDSVTFIADSAFSGTDVTILQEGVSGYGQQYAQQHGLGWVVPED